MTRLEADIKDKLVEKGLGVFGGGSPTEYGIYILEEPPKPNNVITVYQIPGTVQKIMNKPNPFFSSGFQVRVRGNTNADPYDKAEECRKALDRIGRFRVKNVNYDNISIDDEPVFLLKDVNSRLVYILNGTAFRQERLPEQE